MPDADLVCVLCHTRPVDAAWRPFCSERCQMQDLARWADGRYRVAGEPMPSRRRCRTTRGNRPVDDSLIDAMADTLTITDNRTGKQYELPITDGAIRATDLRKIKSGGRRLRVCAPTTRRS